jgi:dipeptidyl-peptidase-3
MRNRQMVAKWAYEKGQDENVIEKKTKDGETFFVINDYAKLRELFGQLLREVQRIKSQGDYEAGKALVETYGVEVDAELHEEVLERYAALDLPSYYGFIQPRLTPVKEAGEIVDVKISYPEDFAEQQLRFSREYGHLPPEN